RAAQVGRRQGGTEESARRQESGGATEVAAIATGSVHLAGSAWAASLAAPPSLLIRLRFSRTEIGPEKRGGTGLDWDSLPVIPRAPWEVGPTKMTVPSHLPGTRIPGRWPFGRASSVPRRQNRSISKPFSQL